MVYATFAGNLAKDRSGATGVLVASSLMALLGSAAVAVDLGSAFLAERRLQGIADAAAIAAAAGELTDSTAHNAAELVIGESGAQNVEITGVRIGQFTRDKSVAINERFVEGGADPSAAHIELAQDVPVFFGSIVTGSKTITVKARATASKMDLAAYSLGTRLAAVSGGVPNQILSALAGTELGMSVMDSQSLASADLDVLGYADALRARAGLTGETFGEVFDTPIPLGEAVQAMADAAPDVDSKGVLDEVSARVGDTEIVLSDIIDLGLAGQTDVSTGDSKVKVDAFSMLRALLVLSRGNSYIVEMNLSAAGLASTSLKLVGGYGMVHSPWLTITSARGYVLRTAQSRLYLEARAGTAPLSVASLHVPVYAELAEAEAKMSDIRCEGDPDSDGVTIEVTPSVGSLAIADVSDGDLADMTAEPTLSPARILTTPLATVEAFSNVDLGGSSPRYVLFSQQDVADRVTKTVGTNDITQTLASSLIEDVNLDVSAGPLAIGAGGVSAIIGNQLATIAPSLDALLYQITETLGVKVGAADVRVDKMRCGNPMLVT